MNFIAKPDSRAPFTAASVWPCLSDGLLRLNSRLVKARSTGITLELKAEQDDKGNPTGVGHTTDIYGDALPKMEIVDGIAILPMCGVLMYRPDRFDRAFGACDSDQFRSDLIAAANDPAVKAIVIDCNSPGGSTSGIAEAADTLADIQQANEKPVFGFMRECASAAYWILSGASGNFAPRSGLVGAIGAYCVVYDYSKWYQEMGIVAHVVKSGDLKGMGTPGTKITDDQLASLQEMVDTNGRMFRDHVKAHRPQVDAADMNGGFWHAEQAAEKGLIDGIAADLNAVIDMVRASLQP